jgi:hypothetical protein
MPVQSVTCPEVTQSNGDIADNALPSQVFGSTEVGPWWTADADSDGDGEIAIGDYAFLAMNFGMIGNE